jgi:4-amino-4-deoxy-L-arabinose transferase-like glycosyltransferase
MMLPAGAVISLAIVVPWYYFLYREHGWAYIGAFIFGENLGRYADAVGEQSRGVLFYLPVMLADLFPWSFLIPLALWWAARERAHSPIARLLLMWTVAIVVFFSFSGTKEDLYILPIVTAEAALIGGMLARAIEGDPARRAVSWASALTGLLLFVAGTALVWVFAVIDRYSLVGGTFVGVVAAAGGAGALVLSFRQRLFAAAATVAGSLVLINWCVVLCTLPDFERYKPVRPFSDVIRSRASVGAIVGSYKFSLPSMVFYLHRPVMEVVLPDHLRAVFHSPSDVYFIMAESEYRSIRERLPVATYVLARQSMFDLKPRNFLDGSELPQFVLISNRE